MSTMVIRVESDVGAAEHDIVSLGPDGRPGLALSPCPVCAARARHRAARDACMQSAVIGRTTVQVPQEAV